MTYERRRQDPPISMQPGAAALTTAYEGRTSPPLQGRIAVAGRDIELRSREAAMASESTVGRFGSGREVQRIEDAALLSGAGRFTDDVSEPGQAFLCFLRSPYAHARISSIDVSRA